ncbi:hypothetical protein JOB18_011271 [Solea senegalensis]|uniref:Uncharacterized protein n=1 Tax=Solea senegalensis TaxID=28829 RepID=A0AAV6SSF3_SOLSE|nr:hypothetical protein JOB18_011271 [Solea senegalensis]
MTDMNDTYAVVNKSKHPHPPLKNPAHCDVAPPRCNRTMPTMPSSHYYDNVSAGASATPIYSCVQRRDKRTAVTFDNHRLGEVLPGKDRTDELISPTNDDYEEFSAASDSSTFCPPAGIGFNCRIQKPRGPREPPPEWS